MKLVCKKRKRDPGDYVECLVKTNFDDDTVDDPSGPDATEHECEPNEYLLKGDMKLVRQKKPKIIRSVRLFLSGGAGVGKSTVTNALYEALIRYLNSVTGENPDDVKVVKSAPTGSGMFNFFNLRLQQIKGNKEPFGGISLITVGDLFQLKPVFDKWIFENSQTGYDALASNICAEYVTFLELTEIMRKKDDKEFAELVNRFRVGKHSRNDIALLKQRFLNIRPEEDNDPFNITHLFTTNAPAHAHNNALYTFSKNEKGEVTAVDMIVGDISDGLRKQIKFQMIQQRQWVLYSVVSVATSAKYDLTTNIDVTDGLTNDKTETQILSNGLKHSVTPKRMATEAIVSSVEAALSQQRELSEPTMDNIRSRIASTIQSTSLNDSNLTRDEQRALKRLRNDENIVILPADKGRVTVVMDKTDYHDKMDALVNDKRTYEELKRDPTPALQRKLNSKLLTLKKTNAFDTQRFEEDKFPKLKAGGGFEVLRASGGGGGQRSLIPVLPTRKGYIVPHLKKNLSSAVGFFRPLQADLDESPTTESDGLFFVNCLHCSKVIPSNEFKAHQRSCCPNSSLTSTGTDEVLVNSEDNDAESLASHFSPQDISLLGPSRRPPQRENVEQLKEVFPEKSSDDLMQALRFNGNVCTAALSLSSTVTEAHNDDVSSDDDSLLQPTFSPSGSKIDSLQSLLKELGKNMSQEKVKVTIEDEDILNDALTYYKSPAFDAKKKLSQFKGQPAVDTGGVTREFFTKLFQVICEMFFQGGKYKFPVYSADIVASGLMRPSVYCYIATGNIDAARAKMIYGDCSEPFKHFIDKVAQAEDVASLDKAECSNMLSECGLAVALTNDDKMRVIQGFIIHDVIGHPKIILDQLAEGLNSLGFRTAMKEYPALLEALFVQSIEKLNADSVISTSVP
ncbi:ATP-dependent DNA helicase PIF1 [Stylophora pistillata]|uniref:ATP-dependent DNA helicase n=1 Tax=Stylophora pistillata TaxID=50429 RepID=A0A2B4S7Q6_STYPI|nr:ATP-dependent DNA helicase PIF1 [Stylophora pistillata]